MNLITFGYPSNRIILSRSNLYKPYVICLVLYRPLYCKWRISGKGVYWGKGESHKFSKKAWKPVVPIGLLLLLPKKSLGWVKNITFWVNQKTFWQKNWLKMFVTLEPLFLQQKYKCCTISEKNWHKMLLDSTRKWAKKIFINYWELVKKS